MSRKKKKMRCDLTGLKKEVNKAKQNHYRNEAGIERSKWKIDCKSHRGQLKERNKNIE